MIPDIIKGDTLQALVDEVQPDPVLYLSNMFPEQNYPEEIIRWQVYTGDPGMAPIVARGVQSPKWKGGGIHEVAMRGFVISEKMDHNEEDINRTEVKDPMKKKAAERLLLDKTEDLLSRSRKTREYIASQIICNRGVVAYKDQYGTEMNIDFNLPDDHVITDLGTDKEWGTGADREPALDCYGMKRKIQQRAGSQLSAVLMNSDTFAKRLVNDAKIQTALHKDKYGMPGKDNLFTKPIETLTWYLDIPIQIYDLTMPLAINIVGRTDASNYTLEDVSKLKVGSQIAFRKATTSEAAAEHWSTITAIDTDTRVVTIADAASAVYVPGRDIVQVEVPFLQDDWVIFMCNKVNNRPIMKWYNSPLGLGSAKYGLRMESWESKDPDVVVTRAQWMGLWALEYPKALGAIYVG